MVWVPLSTNNQGGEAGPCALVKGHLALLGALHFSRPPSRKLLHSAALCILIFAP